MRLMLCLLLSSKAWASPYNFFNGRDIDYWNEGRQIQNPILSSPTLSEPQIGTNLIRSQDAKPFAWENYQDPSKAEFWDDGGDWIPPRPFREAASNPTRENIRSYLNWQEQKALLVARFQKALDQSASQEESPIPWQEVKVLYFYQSSCPHCQGSRALIEELQKKGVVFTFVQLDQEPPLHHPSIPYDQSWAQEFSVSVTPTWVIKYQDHVTTRTGSLSLSDFKNILLKRKK